MGVLPNAETPSFRDQSADWSWESVLLFAEIAGISASANTRKISAKRPLQNATVSWVAFWLCKKTDCHTRFAGSQ